MKRVWSRVGVGFLVAATLISTSISVYAYTSMPGRIAEYVSQHKAELRGEKGAKGDDGSRGPMGISGSNGSSSSVHCSTYQLSTFTNTDCY